MKKLLATAALALSSAFASAQMLPYQNPSLSPQQRADDLIARMTLDEKVSQMVNGSCAIPRLGIPAFEWWNEALHGVARNGFATVFPITTAMAASWNDALLFQVYDAVSTEARAKNNIGRQSGAPLLRYQGLSFWTPNINIFRDPRWGRGQETYGEDPYLTARMGSAVVRGLQGPDESPYRKALACAKHFAVHSGPEWNRHNFNIENLPERDLWETYLPAFRTLIQDAGVREVMCAYQRMDGDPCCGNTRYEQQILRNDWGFDGLVVSDCGAVNDFYKPGHHEVSANPVEASVKAVRSGTDNECGSNYKKLAEAVRSGAISESELDVSLRRALVERITLGDLDPDNLVPWTRIPASVIACDRHRNLSLRMARESMVLLKNDNNTLPLSRNQKILVVGPNANDSIMLWGNYNGYPLHTVTYLEGIRRKNPSAQYLKGCSYTDNRVEVSVFSDILTPDGCPGLSATYYNNENVSGDVAATATYTAPVSLTNGGATVFAPGVNLEHFSARYEGIINPTRTEDLEIVVSGDDGIRLVIDGDTVCNRLGNTQPVEYKRFPVHAVKGKPVPFFVEYVQRAEMAMFRFDAVRTETMTDADLDAQVMASDVVVFCGGISPRLEGEEMKVSAEGFRGGDRTDILLPRVQRDMLRHLHSLGKPVVFVNSSGGAMSIEQENADAILQAWYPGEAGGTALADILFGDANPSGKLPLTFYRDTLQLPDFCDYRMRVPATDGRPAMGRTYRFMTDQPLWPFGHGLSYTTFAFGKPSYENGLVTLTLSNTSSMKGTEVVQVYLRRHGDTDGPLKTLRAFSRVTLEAGQSETVCIPLDASAFEWWDPSTNTMRPLPGTYDILVGNSSADAALQTITYEYK